MKNLFVFWDEPLNFTAGGVHRCILHLMTHLPSRGFNVHYIYSLDGYKTFHYSVYGLSEKILTFLELRKFLIENKCHIILGQEAAFSSTLTQVVKRLNLPGVKFINQYHTSLLYFDKKLTLDYLRFEWNTNKNIFSRLGNIIRGLLYPLWKYNIRRTQNNIYRYNYKNSDVTLLLSEYEKPIMSKITNDKLLTKCIVIPNPLSWGIIATPDILCGKEKEVLIVARIYNTEKRIDLALKVWKILEIEKKTKGWTLRIIGEGPHKDYLMKMADSMHLQNVIWEGRKEPRPYYERASIFLLTSIIEGWALTLTESMQMGGVPIAFDSYPAVRSIITDGYDGYLIPARHLNEMANKLWELMSNNKKRKQMALNGLSSCRRFSIDVIMDEWRDMLNKL